MPSDFNGDGRDDIVWRNFNGSFSNWLANADGSFTINDANAMRHVPTSWNVAGTGDFNGDGRDDVLWVNYDTFQFSDWLATANGGFVINDTNALIALPGHSWFVLGIGDFNSDGRDDILFSIEDTGQRTIWTANTNGSFSPTNVYYDQVAGQYVFNDSVADFDGDGAADLLWHDPASGNVGYWFNWGGELILANPITPDASPGWWIAGTGDFNGDGNDDILWRNVSNGALSNWLSTGTGDFSVNDANAFTVVPLNWHVVAIGDYNGDGRDDILWRNSDTGALSNWLATSTGGFLINDAAALTHADLNWFVFPSVTFGGWWDY